MRYPDERSNLSVVSSRLRARDGFVYGRNEDFRLVLSVVSSHLGTPNGFTRVRNPDEEPFRSFTLSSRLLPVESRQSRHFVCIIMYCLYQASNSTIGRALGFAHALRVFEEFRIMIYWAEGKRQPSDHGPVSCSL